MYYINSHCLVLFCILIHYGVTSQTYFGLCEEGSCGNLTCAELNYNVTTYKCLPKCQNKNTDERDCASTQTCSQRDCGSFATCYQYITYSVCTCVVGFTGDRCNISTEVNCTQECVNADLCTQDATGNQICHCKHEWAGENCTVYLCNNADPMYPCGDHGTCQPDLQNVADGYRCICYPGFTGKNCQSEIDNCAGEPCRNNASCHNVDDSYICNCTGNWTGQHCDVPTGDICMMYNCSAKGANGMCDRECDHVDCDFDNTECTYGVGNPWSNCQAGVKSCVNKFQDGTCDSNCNSEGCLYDGFDCLGPQTCSGDRCYTTINNGVCDPQCNSLPCFWDGNDCRVGGQDNTLGTLILQFSDVPNKTEKEALDTFNRFAQEVGQTTRAGMYVRRRSENMMYFLQSYMWKVYYDVENLFTCDDGANRCWTDIGSYQNALAAVLRNRVTISLDNVTNIAVLKCQEGQYGESCNLTCSSGCRSNTCSSETGNCDCVDGWYGDKCNRVCSLNCKAFCNKCTGSCNGGCHLGFTGDNCTMSCQRGTYGANCGRVCSGNCLDNEPCDHVTGLCNSGCIAGWKGLQCDTECEVGRFGENCEGICGQCETGNCSKQDGVCYGGCMNGWRGSKCKLKVPAPREDKTDNPVVTAVVMVVVFVVAAVIIVLMCIWKQSKRKSKNIKTDVEMDLHKTKINPVTELDAGKSTSSTAALHGDKGNDEEKLLVDEEDNDIETPVNTPILDIKHDDQSDSAMPPTESGTATSNLNKEENNGEKPSDERTNEEDELKTDTNSTNVQKQPTSDTTDKNISEVGEEETKDKDSEKSGDGSSVSSSRSEDSISVGNE